MSLCSKEQVPIPNTCIFEGHLYIRTENKKWKWRLFRFDGTRFTCLKKTDYTIQFIIGVSSIASISLLRKAKRPPICFSIQTTTPERHVFKAANKKDLERWLFVLTKMWTFSQDQQIQICHENTNLALLSNEKFRVIEEWRKSLAELMRHDPNIKQTPPPIEPIPEDDNLSIFTDMTSVSRRHVKKVRRSIRRSTKVIPLLEETSTLKKRRSDDVRHWMGKPEVQPPREGKKRLSMPVIKSPEEEEEEMSLAELLHKLNLTGQNHQHTIIPYTHRQAY
ncbi:unnamed protein product [Rhizopus stolonifer]